MYKNLRWKLLTIAAVFVVFFSVGVYPLLAGRDIPSGRVPCWSSQAKQLKLGLDLKGGVQLRMRVNTDDALKTTPTSTAEHLRSSLATSNITPTVLVTAPTVFRIEGVPPDRGFRSSAAAADEAAAADYDRNSACPAGSYEFKMKPNIERDLRRAGRRSDDADDRSPRQRAGRRRAEHRPAVERRRAAHPDARRQRRRARQGDHRQDRAARVQARRGGAGGEGGPAEAVQRQPAGRSRNPAGIGERQRSDELGVLRRQEDRAGDGQGSARRPSRGSTRTTSRPCTSN